VQGWSAGLDVDGLRLWELAGAAARIRREAAAAAGRDRGLTTTAPLDALAAARARAAPAPGRLALVAAPVAAVVAAFLLLAAGGLRRDLQAELDRLARRGATWGQRAALAVADCAVPVLAGAAAGALAAVAIVAGAGAAGDVGARTALAEGLVRPGILLGSCAVAAARWPWCSRAPSRPGGRDGAWPTSP
jgi:hypothetical protein